MANKNGFFVSRNGTLYAYFGEEKDIVAPVDVVAQGECGQELIWTLDSAGVLKISGSGAMNTSDFIPWKEDSEKIKVVVIEDGVSRISDGAFSNCKNLISVTIPESVEHIGDYAFDNCTSLTTISIPKSVTSAYFGVFENCVNLKSVYFPGKIAEIGNFMFYNCKRLENITIWAGTLLADDAFEKCSSLKNVTLVGSEEEFNDFLEANRDVLPNTVNIHLVAEEQEISK